MLAGVVREDVRVVKIAFSFFGYLVQFNSESPDGRPIFTIYYRFIHSFATYFQIRNRFWYGLH